MGIGVHSASMGECTQFTHRIKKIIPCPEDEYWLKGFQAFSNYNYEDAIKYFEASKEVLAKYYLAKIYFGDVEVNNLERKPPPPINRQRALAILEQYLKYDEIKGLLNDYLCLNADKKQLSNFYFEKGNYEEAIKVRESISAEPSKEDMVFITRCRYFQGIEQRFITPIINAKKVLEQTKVGIPSQQQEEEEEPPFQRIPVEEIGKEVPVVEVDEGAYPQIQPGATVTVIKKILPFRQAVVKVKEAIIWDSPALPNTYYKAVGKIEEGTMVSILDDTSVDWYYKVQLLNGQTGWICSVFLEDIPPKQEEGVKEEEDNRTKKQENKEGVEGVVH
ncbi:MAG: SH3 domain-containing protein [bacterium]